MRINKWTPLANLVRLLKKFSIIENRLIVNTDINGTMSTNNEHREMVIGLYKYWAQKEKDEAI